MKDILTKIAEELVEILVIQKAVQAISGGLQASGGFSAIFGGKAGGGSIAKTGNFMVGESGPEILTLPKGSRITPNKDIGGASTSVNIQVINNAGPETVVDTESERQPDGSQLIKFIIDTVANDTASGGQTARAFQSSFGTRQQAVVR